MWQGVVRDARLQICTAVPFSAWATRVSQRLSGMEGKSAPINIEYPLKISPISMVESISRSEEAPIAFKVTNISKKELGQSSTSKRQIFVRLASIDKELGEHEIIFRNRVGERIPFSEGVCADILSLKGGESVIINGFISFGENVKHHTKANFLTSLYLGGINSPRDMREIQQRGGRLQLTELYNFDDKAQVLLVTNHENSYEEISAWKRMLDKYGLISSEWNLSYYKGIDLEEILFSDKSLLQTFRNKILIFLNNPLLTTDGKSRNEIPFDRASRPQLLKALRDYGIKIYIVASNTKHAISEGANISDLITPYDINLPISSAASTSAISTSSALTSSMSTTSHIYNGFTEYVAWRRTAELLLPKLARDASTKEAPAAKSSPIVSAVSTSSLPTPSQSSLSSSPNLEMVRYPVVNNQVPPSSCSEAVDLSDVSISSSSFTEASTSAASPAPATSSTSATSSTAAKITASEIIKLYPLPRTAMVNKQSVDRIRVIRRFYTSEQDLKEKAQEVSRKLAEKFPGERYMVVYHYDLKELPDSGGCGCSCFPAFEIGTIDIIRTLDSNEAHAIHYRTLARDNNSQDGGLAMENPQFIESKNNNFNLLKLLPFEKKLISFKIELARPRLNREKLDLLSEAILSDIMEEQLILRYAGNEKAVTWIGDLTLKSIENKLSKLNQFTDCDFTKMEIDNPKSKDAANYLLDFVARIRSYNKSVVSGMDHFLQFFHGRRQYEVGHYSNQRLKGLLKRVIAASDPKSKFDLDTKLKERQQYFAPNGKDKDTNLKWIKSYSFSPYHQGLTCECSANPLYNKVFSSKDWDRLCREQDEHGRQVASQCKVESGKYEFKDLQKRAAVLDSIASKIKF